MTDRGKVLQEKEKQAEWGRAVEVEERERERICRRLTNNGCAARNLA